MDSHNLYISTKPPKVSDALVRIFHSSFLEAVQSMSLKDHSKILNQALEQALEDLADHLSREEAELIRELCESVDPLG